MCNVEITPFNNFDLLSFSIDSSYLLYITGDYFKVPFTPSFNKPLLLKGFIIDPHKNIYHAPKYFYYYISLSLPIYNFKCVAIYFHSHAGFIICHSKSSKYPLYEVFDSYPLIDNLDLISNY